MSHRQLEGEYDSGNLMCLTKIMESYWRHAELWAQEVTMGCIGFLPFQIRGSRPCDVAMVSIRAVTR